MSTNTDFLRFSAYSIKELITRKLSQDANFTDQIYEGSNLAILIDIFSYMAQCLLYSLNNAAAESMFSDTQIYENMNRLVNFIGYNPAGCKPSTILFEVDTSKLNDNDEKILPKYSYLDTKLTDKNGKKIYFSTIENHTITKKDKQILLYNGRWKQYNTIFVSNGEPYQKFLLDGLKSSADDNSFVAWKMLDVYVVSKNGNYDKYTCVTEGLFTDNNITNGTYIYANTTRDRIFNLRLNENKTFEITFGNGRNGTIPENGSDIIIMYLESNAINSFETINIKQITKTKYKLYDNKEEAEKMLNINLTNDSTDVKYEILEDSATFTNISESTNNIPEEDIESIRRNAPEWFKTGNRLVTDSDYLYFVKNRFSDNVIDVKCQNNWQYITTFYKWLYENGLNGRYIFFNKRAKNDKYYINQNRIVKYDYKYADASDSNNVYLWIKTRNNSDIYTKVIDNELQPIKMLTQEIVYLQPIHVYFSICAAELKEAFEELYTDRPFNENNYSYIELTIDDNCMYTGADLQIIVAKIIREYFNEEKCYLGQTIDLTELVSKILYETGINKIRTIYNDNNGNIKIINGLSFASWSADFIDKGEDLDISNVSKTLDIFQFPKLYNGNQLESQIKIIRKTINNLNIVQY